MRIVIMDAQGGGVGRAVVEQLKRACPDKELTAVGTNAAATAAMLKAGADRAATGENAVRVNAAGADLIVSEDSHFNVLSHSPFPYIEVLSMAGFMRRLKE